MGKLLKKLLKTTYFENDLLNYFFENQDEQKCQTIEHFNKEDPAMVTARLFSKIFDNSKTTYISGKTSHKNKYEDFELSFLEEKAISLCGQQVQITGVHDVFHSEESLELKIRNLKITVELFLSSVIDTLNFELLKEKIFNEN